MSAIEKLNIIEQVGELKLQGKSHTAIAEELNIKRVEVPTLFKEFQELLLREGTSGSLADSLNDLLFESSQSMRMVLEKLWENYQEAKDMGDNKLAVDILKEIRTLTAQRHKMVQDSGFEDAAFAEEMEETARRQEILIGLLRRVKERHPEVAQEIAEELSRVADEVEVISIEAEE